MKQIIFVLLALAMLAFASKRATRQGKLKWFQQLNGSQKIFGVVAFLLVLLILLNPEFLALGFLGDTALFDMLVLAISLQLHTYVIRAGRGFITAFTQGMKWMGIPSLGLRYEWAVLTSVIGIAVSYLQKIAHRIIS
jgi:hypothetical protein